MPNLNVQFQGQTLSRPGAYYADDVSSVQQGAGPTTPPLVFIGYGYGNKPLTPITYTSPTSLLSALRGGPCSGYVPFMTSPSDQLNGAQQITYINVGEATQSTYTASAGTSGVITFLSANYGLPSNQLQISITAGTVAGKNVSIYDGFSQLASTPGINLGVPFQMAYTGTATGVVMNVAVTGGSAVTLQTLGGNSGENITISLLPSNYATIEGIVQYLNGTGFYSAQVLSNGLLPSSNLDAVSGTALPAPSGGVNAYANVTATLGDIVYWTNTYANTFATATIVSGVTSLPAKSPTAIPYTLFTGATSTPPTLSDYASGFNVALTIPGWTVFADNNTSGVIALGSQHANTASQPAYGRWRRFFSGSSLGDSVGSIQSQSQLNNSKTTSYVAPGIYRTSTATGINTLYSGLYAAAAACGMATGNPPATPLTNKALTGNGVEVSYTSAQIDQLQQAGVMVVAVSQQTGVPTIVSDFTCWQNDSNPESCFNQQVACRFSLGYAMVNALQPYAGTIAATLTEITILNAAKNALNSQIYSTANADGVIDSWDPNTLSLTYTGGNQLAALQVSVALVGQNRFVTMFVPLSQLSINITANANGQIITG